MNNIITAAFGYGNTTKTREVWKIDHGMKLQIRGIRLPAVYQVHFANHLNIGEASVVIATSDTVDIPDIYFSTGKDVYAWIYLTPASGIGYTVYMATIPVRARPLISEYEPTPVQQSAIDQAIGALNDAVEQTAQDVATTGANVTAAQAAQTAAESAQTAAEAARDTAAGYAAASATSASQAATSAAEAGTHEHDAEVAQGKAEDAMDAASGYADDAYNSAERAEQAANTAGYLDVEIVNGDLIYTRTDAVDVDFKLVNGDLVMEVV